MTDTLRRRSLCSVLLAATILLTGAAAICAEAKPKAGSKTAAKAKPKTTRKAAPKAGTKTTPKATPKPKTKAKPKTAPKAGTKTTPRPKTTPKPKPKTTPKPKPKPKTKPKPKPLPKPPNLSFVYPAGARQGTTVQVAVSGVNVLTATGIRITGGGVTGKVLPIKKGEVTKADKKKKTKTSEDRDEQTIRILLTIAPDAKPGVRELRIITPAGISNRHRFRIGQLPEVAETEPNSLKTQAQKLPALPVVVNGQILSSDVDIFRFKAKAGQTIVCEAQAQGILPFIADAVPGWFQAVLTLYDAKGTELAYVDDFRFRPDPVLIHKIPADGEYLIEIKDAVYRGRDDFVYRLTLGTPPYLTDVYPLGAKRGSTAKVTLFGANLPAPSLSIALPANGPVLRPVSVTHGRAVSNVVPFAAGDLPESAETEPNDTTAKPNRIKVPVTVNGRIQRPGDVDIFAITVKAKQKLIVDVRARRLGSPLDSIVAILNSSGRRLVENDDTIDKADQFITHHADSRLVYTFGAAGEYFVRIGDVQGMGGQEYAYRLTVAPPRPNFALRVLPDNPHISPGNTAVLTADAVRIDGFGGRIDLVLNNLPKGFVVSGMAVPAGQSEVRFTVTAPPGAPVGLLRPKLTGTAKIGTHTVTREAVPSEQVLQAFILKHRLPTSEFLLSVVPPAPFALSISPAPAPGKVIEIPVKGEAKFVVKVRRGKNGAGAIRLAADTPPRYVTVKTTSLAAGKNEATITIRLGTQLKPGFMQNIIICGKLKIGKETVTAYAPAIPIKVVAPPKAKPKP